MRRLTDDEFDVAEAALLGEVGDALRQAIVDVSTRQPARMPEGLAQARDLGWVAGAELTDLGRLVVDPIREFVFWERRDRRLLSGDLVPALDRESYSGKSVIELGCGGGANLLSLSGLPGRQVGIDPMPAAIQLIPVLAAVAGLPAPEAVEAAAEDVPHADDEFDIALCSSSHQYMDLHRAFAEVDRIVNDAGAVYIFGGVLGPFVGESAGRFLRTRRFGTLKYDTIAILNTISYQLRGRRAVGGSGETTTATPVYPTARWMTRELAKHDFVVDAEATTRLPGCEMAVIARRP
jgi:SAM-dependent methyltransferase